MFAEFLGLICQIPNRLPKNLSLIDSQSFADLVVALGCGVGLLNWQAFVGLLGITVNSTPNVKCVLFASLDQFIVEFDYECVEVDDVAYDREAFHGGDLFGISGCALYKANFAINSPVFCCLWGKECGVADLLFRS